MRCGTIDFAAPEIFMDNDLGYCSKTSDIWSLGIVLYCMVEGFFPFGGNNNMETINYIQTSHISFFNNLSSPLKDLILKILCKKSFYRIKIYEIIKHNWLLNVSKIKKPINNTNSLPSLNILNKIYNTNKMYNSFDTEKYSKTFVPIPFIKIDD